jgi:hypothetical protein
LYVRPNHTPKQIKQINTYKLLDPLLVLDAMVETLNNPSTSSSTFTSTSTYLYNTQDHDYHENYAARQEKYYDHQDQDIDDDDEPPVPPPKDNIESSRRDFGDIYHSSTSALSASFELPEGMDVREALAQCEDPALGWSLQFWATIVDPLVSRCLTLVFILLNTIRG